MQEFCDLISLGHHFHVLLGQHPQGHDENDVDHHARQDSAAHRHGVHEEGAVEDPGQHSVAAPGRRRHQGRGNDGLDKDGHQPGGAGAPGA